MKRSILLIMMAATYACSKTEEFSTEREKELAKEEITKHSKADSLLWETQGLRFHYPDSLSIEGSGVRTPHEYNSWQTFAWNEMTEYILYAHPKQSHTDTLTIVGHTDSPTNPKVRMILMTTIGSVKQPILRIRKGIQVFLFKRP